MKSVDNGRTSNFNIIDSIVGNIPSELLKVYSIPNDLRSLKQPASPYRLTPRAEVSQTELI